MKRPALGVCCLSFLALHCIAQIKEPQRVELTQEEYMTALIDSLAISEEASDTIKIIQYTSVLTTEFQSAGMFDRAASYLQVALRYSSACSDSTHLPDVYNRAGMLMQTFTDGLVGSEFTRFSDSCRYFHWMAIHKALAIGKLGTAGWGYRGLLQNAVQYRTSVKDSIQFYYNNTIELATRVDDLDLIIYCTILYGQYLSGMADLHEAKPLIEKMSRLQEQMTPKQKVEFYILLHDYLAKVNRLDTLRAIRTLIIHNRDFVVAARHGEELYNKDQQYEVSKTKNILEETSGRLDVTNRVLVGSIIALIGFVVLVTYLFFLFKKSKRLSKRNELLLREQNHRVKNNLQLISSLLSLQSQKLISTDAKDALLESQSRINSVALLHRLLYEGKNVGNVEVTAYIRSLAEEIQYSAGREMEIELDLPIKVELEIEKVTSLGLIINELLTNSIKHVDQSNLLRVQLCLSVNVSKLHLVYTDNGTGVLPEVWKSSNSFGNQLIQLQSQQLGGDFDVGSARGFKFDLRISS